MSVFNVLPSGVNTFFPTFWKLPDALIKKGLWLAAYLHTNQSRSYLNHLVLLTPVVLNPVATLVTTLQGYYIVNTGGRYSHIAPPVITQYAIFY
jgi:hypothetical protein